MSVTSGEKLPSYSTVKNWVAGFRTAHLSRDSAVGIATGYGLDD
jgi:hypothetical protein